MRIKLYIYIFLILLFSSCAEEQQPVQPVKVETTGVEQVTSRTAICKGKIVDYGSGNISEFGIELDNGEGYQKMRCTTSVEDEFGVELTELIPGHMYCFRAYAKDGEDTRYGAEKYFTTLQDENALPELISFEVLPGFKRAQVIGVFLSTSDISHCKVFWDGGAWSMTIDVHDMVDNKVDVVLELPEKENEIDLHVYNSSGEEIFKRSESVMVYGDSYLNSLVNVEVRPTNFNITANYVKLIKGDMPEDALRTELIYTNVHLEEKVLINPEEIGDITAGVLRYRTAYLPEEKMLDTLYTDYDVAEVGDLSNQSTGINPFIQGAEGYFAYRIPSMVVSGDGTILAFAEGRRNSIEDTGDIDIVLKRSTDNGATWSALEIVKDDGVNRCQNPVPIVIPETNRIVLLYCWNVGSSGERRVFVTYSDDEGITWTGEKEITKSVKPEDWNWYAVGPCHGIVKTREPHKGRLVVPANHTIKGSSQTYSHVIYSDDQGKTWQLGGTPCVNTNESTVAELSNGDLMLNMRRTNEDTQPYRITSTSGDGGATWENCVHDKSLPSPGCQGSLLTYDFNGEAGKARLLFSNPAHPSSRRNNTLRLSNDDGVNWTRQLMYVQKTGQSVYYSAYSDIAKLNEGDVAVLYEKGYRNEEGIWFRTIKLSELQ